MWILSRNFLNCVIKEIEFPQYECETMEESDWKQNNIFNKYSAN